jgi:protein gp37
MGEKTSIEWAESSWTPIRARVKPNAAELAKAKGYTSLVKLAARMAGHVGPHCEHVSPGCEHCYSGTNNSRCLPANGTGLPFDRRSRDLVDIQLDRKILEQPLHWRRGRGIFVCSQTDLFGEFVPFYMIDEVFSVMVAASHHTWMILTKRSARMREYFGSGRHTFGTGPDRATYHLGSNVWLGVSVEDNERRYRIDDLCACPADVRFVSAEPLLEHLDLATYLHVGRCTSIGPDPENFRCGLPADHAPHHHSALIPTGASWFGKPILNWVIIGGESGPDARPFKIQSGMDLIAQCQAAKVPCFMKQIGSNSNLADWTGGIQLAGKGNNPAEWPRQLRVREMPQRRGG